jgi:hypothetical protein
MNPAVTTRTEGNRTYLEGVDFRSWSGGEMCEFASALTSMLRCVGEDTPYHYVLGVTGVAFRFTFGPEHWNPGFYGFEGVSADVQDLIRRAFAAVGYGYSLHTPGDRPEDLRRIRASLDRGITVMLKGHVVDASDWVIITGYEGDGDVLFGLSPYGGRERFKGYDLIHAWHPRHAGTSSWARNASVRRRWASTRTPCAWRWTWCGLRKWPSGSPAFMRTRSWPPCCARRSTRTTPSRRRVSCGSATSVCCATT